MRFIGIDLAWTYKNETGVCVINESGEVEYLKSAILSDEDIVSIIKRCSHEPVSIAIDAPLIVKNESGSRQAERDLMSEKIHGHNVSLFVASRSYLSRTYGQIRGEVLMNLIKKEVPSVTVSENSIPGKSTIIETFPSAVCCGLFPEIYPVKYKIKRKVAYEETRYQMERILERFRLIEEEEKHVQGLVSKLGIGEINIDKNNHKHIEDKVDAFLSAYGIYSIHKGIAGQKTFGDVENGFITIPIAVNKNSLCSSEKPKTECMCAGRMFNSADITKLTIQLGELAKTVELDNEKQVKAFRKFEREVEKIKQECFENK